MSQAPIHHSEKLQTFQMDQCSQQTWLFTTSLEIPSRATWISLHNGGGVGWGEVINGGFGLLIDGSAESEENFYRCSIGM